MRPDVAPAPGNRGPVRKPEAGLPTACANDDAVRRLRIVMVVQGYVPSVGGAERQAITLAQALQQAGHGVRVLCPRLDPAHGAGPGWHQGVELWRIGYPRWPGIGALVLLLKQAWFMHRTRGSYDAVHVQIADQMGAVAVLAGRLLGKPVVVKFAGSWERERGSLRRRGLLPKLLRLMLRRASAVQATSRRFVRELAGFGFRGERLHWLPNAVDVSRFAGRAPDVAAPSMGAHRTLLFVGRLVPDKGLDVLLRAWALTLGRDSGGWRLRLVGEGAQFAALAELARALSIADSVDFVGELESVDEELRRADASVLPSLREGLSNALLEAMAASLPVVATRVSGSEDFIRSGHNGWLCEPGDIDSLAEALSALGATDPGELQRMGRQAREDVERHASLAVVTRQLLQLYAGVAPARGGPA